MTHADVVDAPLVLGSRASGVDRAVHEHLQFLIAAIGTKRKPAFSAVTRGLIGLEESFDPGKRRRRLQQKVGAESLCLEVRGRDQFEASHVNGAGGGDRTAWAVSKGADEATIAVVREGPATLRRF